MKHYERTFSRSKVLYAIRFFLTFFLPSLEVPLPKFILCKGSKILGADLFLYYSVVDRCR